jgi:hypothetical protein
MTTKAELKAQLELEKKQLRERQKTKIALFDKSVQRTQTRKKIILGAVMLKSIEGKAKNVIEFAKIQLANLKEKDKALFPELFPESEKETEIS